MSESGSGKVTVAKTTKGDVLRKKDINDTHDSWEHVSERITGQNIREEGLDRRVFKSDETWGNTPAFSGKGASASESYYSGGPKYIRIDEKDVNQWLTVTNAVATEETSGESLLSFRNGMQHDACCISWDWDPNLDTYCIIRCSFYMEFDLGNYGHQGRDSDGETIASEARSEQFFKFGIAVKRTEPGAWPHHFFDHKSYGYKGVRRLDNPTGDIFAVQQIGLNRGWSKYTSKYGAIRHQYDRRTKMTSSFTLIASGSSGENNHTFNLQNNMCAIDMREPGTYHAVLVVRRKKNFPHETHFGSEPGSGTEPPSVDNVGTHNNTPKIGHVNMHVQKFRR